MAQDSSTPTPNQPISSTAAFRNSESLAVSHQLIKSNKVDISRLTRTYYTDWTGSDDAMRQKQSQGGSLPGYSSSPTRRFEEPGVNFARILNHNGTFPSVAPNSKRPELSRTDTELVISSQTSKGLKWEATEIIDAAVLMTPLGLLPEEERSNASVEPFRLLTSSQAQNEPSLLNSQETLQSQDPRVTQAQEQRPFPPPVCAAPTSVFDPFDTCLLRPDVYNNIGKLKKCVSEPRKSLSD